MTGRPPNEELPVETTEYAIAMRKHLEVHRMRDHQKFAGNTMRRHYGSKFQVGDLVWLRSPEEKGTLTEASDPLGRTQYHCGPCVCSGISYSPCAWEGV